MNFRIKLEKKMKLKISTIGLVFVSAFTMNMGSALAASHSSDGMKKMDDAMSESNEMQADGMQKMDNMKSDGMQKMDGNMEKMDEMKAEGMQKMDEMNADGMQKMQTKKKEMKKSMDN